VKFGAAGPRGALDPRKAWRPGPSDREFRTDLAYVGRAVAPQDKGAVGRTRAQRRVLVFVARKELTPEVEVTSGVL
jgi:hypothetical protein